MKVAAIILAAGASRRMGSPKALLRLGTETFLDRLIRVYGETCESVTVVLGHDADTIRSGLAYAAGASFVVNPDPERGQLSSLQCGLAAVPEGSDAVAFSPVDYAAVQPGTIRAIAGALADSRAVLAVPRCEGRHGHPVLFRAALAAEFLALPLTDTARDVVHAHADRTIHVDSDDTGTILDADTPEEYAALRKVFEEG